MTRPSTPPGFSGGGHGVYGAAGNDVGVRNTISVDHGSLDMYIETGGGATISYYGYNLFSTYGGGFDPNDIAYAGNNQVPPANLEHLFIDLSTTDLHLELSGHRAGNRGLDLSGSFTGDIDGTTRTVTWDIGADEGVTGTAPLPPRSSAGITTATSLRLRQHSPKANSTPTGPRDAA